LIQKRRPHRATTMQFIRADMRESFSRELIRDINEENFMEFMEALHERYSDEKYDELCTLERALERAPAELQLKLLEHVPNTKIRWLILRVERNVIANISIDRLMASPYPFACDLWEGTATQVQDRFKHFAVEERPNFNTMLSFATYCNRERIARLGGAFLVKFLRKNCTREMIPLTGWVGVTEERLYSLEFLAYRCGFSELIHQFRMVGPVHLGDEQPANIQRIEAYVWCVLCADGYLTTDHRFFNIAKRLPTELMAVVVNRAHGLSHDLIHSGPQLDDLFRENLN